MKQNANNQDTAPNTSGFAGTLRNIQLTDIIQMCCLAGASLCVRVRQDADQGTIYINEGEVVHAECGDLVGIEAFFAILGWQSGQFETMDAPAVSNHTIKEACQFLLMEAARQADEIATRQSIEIQPEVALTPSMPKLRVLIVDDSPIMAKILTSMMAADPTIDVVGTAKNGEEALEKIKILSPELITMDVNMPVMGGNTALKHIMIGSPCPVLIMSNLGPASYPTLLSFLNLGAVDFMRKPVKSSNIVLQQQRIVERVHLAAKANVKRFQRLRNPKLNPSEFIAPNEGEPIQKLLIAHSGTGGYFEMVNLMTALPFVSETGVLSLQSIPPLFAPTLASFLNLRSRFDVRPFQGDDILCPGRCYLGTTIQNMKFGISDGQIVLHRQEKSTQKIIASGFDELLFSSAELFLNRVVVVLLSGADLGSLEGLRAVKAAGGQIITPTLAHCILPATLEPAHAHGLITDTFDPEEMHDMLVRHCT
jgi:two-component system, chemotaxis family, protein-glutamate methylesterase/glutaminase